MKLLFHILLLGKRWWFWNFRKYNWEFCKR